MVRAFLALGFFSSTVFAHPGHGALDIHWHAGDIGLAVLAAVVFFLIVFLVRKALKR